MLFRSRMPGNSRTPVKVRRRAAARNLLRSPDAAQKQKGHLVVLRLSSQIAQNVINSQLLGACELLTVTKCLFFTYKILQNNPETGTKTQFRGVLAGECGRAVGGLQNSSKSLLIWVGRNFRNLHPMSVDKKSMRS